VDDDRFVLGVPVCATGGHGEPVLGGQDAIPLAVDGTPTGGDGLEGPGQFPRGTEREFVGVYGLVFGWERDGLDEIVCWWGEVGTVVLGEREVGQVLGCVGVDLGVADEPRGERDWDEKSGYGERWE